MRFERPPVLVLMACCALPQHYLGHQPEIAWSVRQWQVQPPIGSALSIPVNNRVGVAGQPGIFESPLHASTSKANLTCATRLKLSIDRKEAHRHLIQPPTNFRAEMMAREN